MTYIHNGKVQRLPAAAMHLQTPPNQVKDEIISFFSVRIVHLTSSYIISTIIATMIRGPTAIRQCRDISTHDAKIMIFKQVIYRLTNHKNILHRQVCEIAALIFFT